MYITLTSLCILYLYYNILQTFKSVCIYFSLSTIVVQKQNYRLIVAMLTYHHEKYVQIYLMVLLTKSTTVFLFLVVHLFNPLIAKPHHTITQQKSQGCLVVNAAVQENPQNIPEITINNRNISCQNQFFLLNISVSHLMSSK